MSGILQITMLECSIYFSKELITSDSSANFVETFRERQVSSFETAVANRINFCT